MNQHNWKVVPISARQKLDVREDDLLNNGHFRKCETYRGGGGYDQFPSICKKRLGIEAHTQFVVQLYGCNLDCPYCYVTQSGIWGEPVIYTSDQLVKAFVESEQEVFHLMGGAPAIYLNYWPELISRLPDTAVFHSDFLLSERLYAVNTLQQIADLSNCLFAVDIKGVTDENYKQNTKRNPDWPGMLHNLYNLLSANIPFYLTYTNPDKDYLEDFQGYLVAQFGYDSRFDDSFVIDLILYNALS